MLDADAPFPALRADLFDAPTQDRLTPKVPSAHPPRFLMLYGSLRERSYSRLLTFEAARLLEAMGGEVKVFDPRGLPLPDAAPDTDAKVVELRALAQWAEGMVWSSPERHGSMSGIMKAQIDWIPLALGAVRPTQGLAALAHPVGAAALLVAGAPAAAAFSLFHDAGNGILTIANGTLPLVLFGPEGYGARKGWLMAPARMAQALAPFVFGLALEAWGVPALAMSAALGLMAFIALMLLSGSRPATAPKPGSTLARD